MRLRESRLERLVDADPRWVVRDSEDGHGRYAPDADLDRTVVGVVFACPIHDDPACLVHVFFAAPFGAPGPAWHANVLWDRVGDAFEALTLAPSIRKIGPECGWHGYVTEGRLITLPDSR